MKANGGEGGEGERNEVMLHILITYKLQTFERVVYQAIGEGGMEGGRKGGRREGWRDGGREGGREGWREGGREGGGREGGREGEREGESNTQYVHMFILLVGRVGLREGVAYTVQRDL